MSARSTIKHLHIELPGAIVNIQIGLRDAEGREVTRIDVQSDGNRYAGDPEWWVDGVAGDNGRGFRIIRMEPAKAMAD
jgi:hypothetical protein